MVAVVDEEHDWTDDRWLAYALRAQPLFRPLPKAGPDERTRTMMSLLADWCLAVAREAGDRRVRR